MFPDPFDLEPLILFRKAIRRSRVRVDTLLVLLEHGAQSLTDLARLVGADVYNVYGALWGVGRRYRAMDALIVLGLVRHMEGSDGQVVYELTPIGAAAARALRRQVDRRRGPRPIVRA